MRRTRAFPFLTVLTLLAVVVSGSPITAQARVLELGAESPEALVARMQSAAAALDFAELAACLDPDSRREMAGGLYLGSVMMVAFSGMMAGMGEMMGEMTAGMAEAFGDEEAGEQARLELAASPELAEAQAKTERLIARFNEVAGRHGLPLLEEDDDAELDQESFEEIFETVDQPALIADLMGFLLEMMEEMGDSEDAMAAGPGDELSQRVPMGELTDLVIDGDSASGLIDGERVELVRLDGRWFAKIEERGHVEGGPGDETGPEEAAPLAIGDSRLEGLHGGGNWYVITAPAAGTITVVTQGTGESDGDLVLEAYFGDDFSMPAERSDQDLEGDSAHESVTVTVTAGQELYLKVRRFGFSDEAVTFQLSATSGD